MDYSLYFLAGHAAFCYPAQHPDLSPDPFPMIRCHLAALMKRKKLRISDVAHQTGLNRSTIRALAQESVTRIELPAIEKLCLLFDCEVGELLQLENASGPDHVNGARP